MGDRENLKAAMSRWEKMDEQYRARIGRQIKGMNRLLNANTIMLRALQQVAKMKAQTADVSDCRQVAQAAIDEAQAVLAVPEDEQEENNG